jgi:tetratricopeptide (TPR) repeat protein
VAQDQGDYTQAAAFLRESLAMTQEAGDTWLTAWTLTHLGQIAYARREYAEANAYFAEGLMLFQALRSTWAVLRPLEGLALVAAAQGMLERLVRLLGFVAPLREALGIASYESEQAEFDRLLALACHELESDAFEAAWATGQAMALEEAIAEARAET